MRVEQDSPDVAAADDPGISADGATVAETVARAVGRLEGGAARCVAVAPGRLDVIGGLTEYAGACVLGIPLGHHVAAAAQVRTDGKLWLAGLSTQDSARFIGVPLMKLVESNGHSHKAGQTLDASIGNLDEPGRCVLGALVEGVREGLLRDPSYGLSISVACSLDGINGGGRHAALAAATLAAATAALGHEPDGLGLALACQRVENYWFDAPVGPADAACSLLGDANALLEVRCESTSLGRRLQLGDDLALLAVDSDVSRPDAPEKYRQVRTAAYMGRLLIDRIIRHEGHGEAAWDGHLARLSVSDFVTRFRDRLPTKMKGRDFLDRFGETGDPLTRINPAETYKIRSRTEHHVYEHARAGQFMDALESALRVDELKARTAAGELMYASHWSYGQRCGVGSAETDLLVNLLRRYGRDARIFGAKITGRGCGGLVAVLLERSERSLAALDAALEDYAARTGRCPRILRGSIPGALVAGIRRV